MSASSMLRFVIAGGLRRDTILTPKGKPRLDIPGGNVIYTAVGAAVWDNNIGLLSRVGEDYPQEWIEEFAKWGFDVRGIKILPEAIDLRFFVAYTEGGIAHLDNPVQHFARLELPFPRALLDYNYSPMTIDSRTRPTALTIRLNDIPADYLDATAVHICPSDFLSHNLLPSTFRRGHANTVTLDPGDGYMTPTFWDDIPSVMNGLTAFICSEKKLHSLFHGRITDTWEMIDAIANFGCEIIVIKRGLQGTYIYDHSSHGRWMIPAYPARVEDPTGAGNAFCGGFLAGYRSTYDPVQAGLYGSISASLVVEGNGPFYALDALPSLPKARMDVLKDMVRKM